jgi:hypothetical protein
MVPLNQHIWNILKNWMSFPIAIGDPWARFLREWGPAHRYLARGLDNSGIPEEETKTTSGDPARARHVWNKTWEATHLVVISKESITSKNWNKHSQNRCTGPCFCFIEDGLLPIRQIHAHHNLNRVLASVETFCGSGPKEPTMAAFMFCVWYPPVVCLMCFTSIPWIFGTTSSVFQKTQLHNWKPFFLAIQYSFWIMKKQDETNISETSTTKI